jgi:hypothetical protein
MKFKRYMIYSLKESTVEYVMGIRGSRYYFLYYKTKSAKRWTPYPATHQSSEYSFLVSKANKAVSHMIEISKQELFAEVL